MNFTEQYIEMCRKAGEVQELRPVEKGAWIDGVYVADKTGFYGLTYPDSEYGSEDYRDGEFWLPLQHELHRLLSEYDYVLRYYSKEKVFIADDAKYSHYGTAEEALLQLLCCLKFKKIWVDSEWVKLEE